MYEDVLFAIPSYTHGLVGRKYKNLREAIEDGFYLPWDEERIRCGFKAGNGTVNDLKRFCKDNEETILSASEFFNILEYVNNKQMHLNFIRSVLHY